MIELEIESDETRSNVLVYNDFKIYTEKTKSLSII